MHTGIDPVAALTDRERDVLALMAQGRTDVAIGKQLFVTRKTIEFHARNIFRKLNVPAGADANRRVHAVLVFLTRPAMRQGRH
jgi:DNA-binding NarL/FixJ family response regulator